jgi:trimethylamine--corrinoid protein Co-methyltransferase
MLESMLTVAYEQFVIDDEIIGMCCKTLKGITVDAEHLALEVIDATGPGGNYMVAPHTMAHLHNEYFRGNSVTDQNGRDKWAADGEPDARERGRRIARKLLSEEETPYIDPGTDQAIRAQFDILL